MVLTDVLLSVFEIAAIIPIGILCLLIFDKDSIIPKPLSLWLYTGIFTALSAIGGYLRLAFSINVNTVILAVFAVMIMYLMFTVKTGKFKMLYIITSCGGVSSSLRLYGYLLEAHLCSNDSFIEAQHWGLVLRWGLGVVLLFLFAFILKKVRWLMYESSLDKFWKVLWAVPLIIDAANMITVPHEYSIMQQGRIELIYVTTTTTLVIMQVVFHLMLYTIAKSLTEKAKLDKQAHILSAQASQYERLQRYIENTSKLRHDFKHMARTAVSLAQKGDKDAMVKLLTDYGIELEAGSTQTVFTKNSTLNALIGYCYENARQRNIRCDWQVNLPEKLNVEDIDLCSVVGNLLENAIHACADEDEKNRYITFKADVEDNGDIYIVTTNGFSGKVKKNNGKYLSTKKDGSGIGIESIKTTVNCYNGFVKFYNDCNTFYADVMIKQNCS